MTVAAPSVAELQQAILQDELLKLVELDNARAHPAFLLHHVTCVDSRSGEVFEFEVLSDAEYAAVKATARGQGWYWQRELLDWWIATDQTIVLKGRQLGVTWVACGLALWYLLFRPGADVLVYSITQDDAREVIGRIWDMLQSLRDNPRLTHLLDGGKVIKPSRAGVRPADAIEVEHVIDGHRRISSVTAMSSSSSAGHGRSAALVIFDEAARQEYARTTWKAVLPSTADKGGKILVISTADGMSDERSGLGNFFHYLWVKAGTVVFPGLQRRFLRWSLHPDRDEAWRANLSMPSSDKAEQYPNDPEEAFLLSGSPYFDPDALKHYAKNVAEPLFTAEFEPDPDRPNVATLAKRDGAPLSVFALPVPGRPYALAADTATGSGLDFSVGALIDLTDGSPAAELYMKGDYDQFARQLHFLGLWYNTARIAPEKAGGYGDTIIAYLRDGHEGRKPYLRIYQHVALAKKTSAKSKILGFPMTVATRPKVVSELRVWVNGQLLPAVTAGFLRESRTFVHRNKKPSPAADDGANDDCVMAWGIALEMFSLFGEHPHDRKTAARAKRAAGRRKPKPLYPWEKTAA